MKKNVCKVIEIISFVLIIGISILIFLLRNRLKNVGKIGFLSLFALCFVANSSVLLPAPGLLIVSSCALIMNPWIVALVAALGTTVGELVGYIFGCITNDISPRFQSFVEKISKKIQNPLLIVFVFAVLPLPLFDIVGVYSGSTKMNLAKFSIVCFVGKLVKMLFFTRMYNILKWASSVI